MVKHTQTIRRLLIVLDHFVRLAIKGLKLNEMVFWNVFFPVSL